MPFGCFGKRKKKDKSAADGAAPAGDANKDGPASGDVEVSESVTAARAQGLQAAAPGSAASTGNIQKSATLARYDFLRKSDYVNSADRWAALKEQYLAPKMSQSQHHGDQLGPPATAGPGAANGPARGPGRAAQSLPRQFSPPSTVVSVVKFSHWFYERQIKEEEARRDAHEREEKNRTDDPAGEDATGEAANSPDVANAAAKIQAGFKGYQTRKHLAEARSHTEQEDQEQHPPHQQDEQQQQQQQQQQQHPDDEDSDPQMNAAAAKIQAGFKGMQARKEVREMRKHKDSEPTEEGGHHRGEEDGEHGHHDNEQQSVEEMNAAAAKIQAGFKGYKTRKEMGSVQHDQHQQPEDHVQM